MASQDYYNEPPKEQPPQQPPPTYGQNYGPQAGPDKGSFDQAFKLDKPKWNDLWAGILVWTPHHIVKIELLA